MAKMIICNQNEFDDFDDCSFSSNEYKDANQDDFLYLHIAKTTISEDNFSIDNIEISANFCHIHQCKLKNINYGISDGGVDSCVLGKDAHIINHTGCLAILVGYDDKNTRSGRVPIVSAYIKIIYNHGKHILLFIYEATHLAHSNVTLYSEY